VGILEVNVKLLSSRVSSVAEPNVPINPNYRNHELEANQKYYRLIPMENDDMFVALETATALTASALAASIPEKPDKVCFLPVLAIEMF
jgi:hypothetical protein